MKRIMFVVASVVALFFGSVSAQSNLYVAIINVENSNFVCHESMSFEAYAELVKNGDDEILKEEYPQAAFVLIHCDPKTGALMPTDAQRELKYFKHRDPNWYARDVNIKNILIKSGKLFLNSCEVIMLVACWAGSEVIIPGSLELHKQSNKFAKWAQQKYHEAFPAPAVEA